MPRTPAARRPSRPRRPGRLLAASAAAIGLAAALPAGASAAPATWDEFAASGLPQPTVVHPAQGAQRMIMVAIPGGGWSAGTNTLLDLYGYMDWWTTLAQQKGITVHVITHRQGGFSGAVPLEIADLGRQLGTIRQQNPNVPICVYGLSSGGHLAAMLQILRPDITKCVVSDGGPLDMEAFFQDAAGLRGITIGDFIQGQTAQTQVRDWFNTPEHPDNVSRLDPATQTGRIGRLFAIEAGRNPDGSAADRSVGDRQGEMIRQRIPDRTVVRYVHAARDGEESVPTAHNVYSSFLDGSPGGAEATEARKIYGEAADWMLDMAAKGFGGVPVAAQAPPPAGTPAPPAATPVRVAVALRSTTARPDSRGRIAVRVRCTGASTSCRGTVKATFSLLPSRSVSYKIDPRRGTEATVRIPLTTRQLERLARRASTRASVRMTAVSPGRASATKTSRITLRRTAAIQRRFAAR
jgi:acetyl esterase/lipase